MGTLAGGLGCFPLDDEAYPPPSDWSLSSGYSEFVSIWYRSPSPHRNSALPPRFNHYRCASTHFGENQLAPGSIGISPLTTAHPPPFQRWSVRTSTWYHPSFILAMVRSPGFGSTNYDFSPCSDSLSLGLWGLPPSPAITCKSPAHSSTGTRSDVQSSSHCL